MIRFLKARINRPSAQSVTVQSKANFISKSVIYITEISSVMSQPVAFLWGG